MTKRKGNRRHTEFAALTLEEVASIARNPNLPADVRRKAQTEEKARGIRNRQKRHGPDAY